MTKRLLELFSGTNSIGKVAKKMGYEVLSLDRDLPSDIKEDIMTWNYKIYPEGYFDIITASPVCAVWSKLRYSNVGRTLKMYDGKVFTKEMLLNDIETIGKPMVNKVREILDYFKPKYWWIENPHSSSMRKYITDLPNYVVSYCKYSDWGYQKDTIFWTNIKDFKPKRCKQDCESIVDGRHKIRIGNRKKGEVGNNTTKLERYRIPPKLIEELLEKCV